jgi:transcriptional regulator with XRE-family HTH domain
VQAPIAPSGETRVFKDKWGDQRVLVKRRGPATQWQLQRERVTPVLALNRVIGRLIGLKIREVRQAKGLSLSQLCIRAGLSSANPKNRMREIEMGERQEGVRLGTLYAIASALGCSPGSLLPDVKTVMEEAGVTLETQTIAALSVPGEEQLRGF